MTWTYGGETLEQVITSATLTPYTGETPGEPETIELPYTFPVDSKKSYILTYTTSLPEDAAVGADLSVTNTAWLGNWKAEYTIDGTVPGETGLVKTFTGQGDGDAVKSDLNWSSIITFPQGTLEAATLDSVRYVDIIQDAVNEGWQLQAGTHYTTPELLQQLVAAPVDGYNQQAELKYGTDYTIQVVTAEDFQAALGETYYNATGVGYVFETVACDQLFEGFSYGEQVPVEEIEGNGYIGLLEIPALGLSLPVMSEWSYPNLKLAPCRYSGSAYTGNFTIAGHNYSTHFGPIGGLNAGDSITFNDMQGNRFAYEVQVVETLEAAAVADMVSEEWDLTLFTCDLSGESRVTVRCLQV